jgi:hypothetical protein
MNIEASIIDQRLTSIVNDIRQPAFEQLRIEEPQRLKSLAFVYLCVKTVLDLEVDETFDCLTEGGGDFGVDAIHISEEYDGEFVVSLFQAKYKHKDLSGDSNFPETGIDSLIRAIRLLFDPAAQLQHINPRLLAKVEEARSLIRDGFIPQVRAIACNNGIKWNTAAEEAITRASFGDQVTWEHVNHASLVKILQASKPVTKFTYNALQTGDFQVKVENLQIINGGQTCMTIFQTLQQLTIIPNEAFVLLRLYQLPSDNEDLVQRITFATNSQIPVGLRDLRANDEVQRRLEMDIQQLGFAYRRKSSDSGTRAVDITSGVAAEAVLSVWWRHRPQQAKFFTREHFGRLYGEIFSPQLNGAQVVLAVQLYRIAENRRKRPEDSDPIVVKYAACFIAMQMGRRLLAELNLTNVEGISHLNFKAAYELVKANGNRFYIESLGDIQSALSDLYSGQVVSLQQLSATFRRGDLIERLSKVRVVSG